MLQKNTAGQFIYFALLKAADGTAHTGQTPTGYVSIDAAAQTGIGGSIAELANGQYKMVLSQGDTNGDELGYFIVNAASIPVSITVTTETKKMADLNDIAAGANMGLADDAITSAKYDQASAFPIESADSDSTQIARTGADGDTLESISDEIFALPTDANVTTQCALALSNIHLDHLLGVDFDSGAPVGNATSFLRQLVEDDSDTLRFTANTLEQGPGGGDATEAKQDTIITDIAAVPDAAAINAQVDTAIETYHLDHLLAVDYDADSPVGHATSFLRQIMEVDSSLVRFTEAAVANAPGALGDATEAKQDTIIANIATTDGKVDTMDTNVDDIETLLGTVDGKIDTMDTNVDDIETLLGTVDGKIDTMDTNVDDIETLLGTVDGKVDTADTAIDLIMDILEGDQVVDDNETPYEYLIKRKGTATVLVTKEMYELDDTNITGVDQVVSKLIEPA